MVESSDLNGCQLQNRLSVFDLSGSFPRQSELEILTLVQPALQTMKHTNHLGLMVNQEPIETTVNE